MCPETWYCKDGLPRDEKYSFESYTSSGAKQAKYRLCTSSNIWHVMIVIIWNFEFKTEKSALLRTIKSSVFLLWLGRGQMAIIDISKGLGKYILVLSSLELLEQRTTFKFKIWILEKHSISASSSCNCAVHENGTAGLVCSRCLKLLESWAQA